jgi:methylglutaconyl-CoA hydratase
MKYCTVDNTTLTEVITVTLNRPEVHNAFNDCLISEITETFLTIGKSELLRLVVLRGSGKSFCAGADIESMKQAKEATLLENQASAQRLGAMFEAINSVPVPIVGVVQGLALGGGAGLVAVCDYVIASSKAQFGFTETRLGIVPAVISPYLIRKIGQSAMRSLFITGKLFDASESLRLGLIHHCVNEGEDMNDALKNVINTILLCGPEANKNAKRLIAYMSEEKDIAAQQEYAVNLIAASRVSTEGQEGLSAFLEKRKPYWLKVM